MKSKEKRKQVEEMKREKGERGAAPVSGSLLSPFYYQVSNMEVFV